MQMHKNLASGEKSGKTFAIMNSEQAHPRLCWINQAGDAFTSLSLMHRLHAGLSRQNVNMFRPDPIF
jgi:hypothetical protein